MHKFKSERNEILIQRLQDNYLTDIYALDNFEKELSNLQDIKELEALSDIENDTSIEDNITDDILE